LHVRHCWLAIFKFLKIICKYSAPIKL